MIRLLAILALMPLAALSATHVKNQKNLAEAFVLFNKGAYAQAVEKAQSVQASNPENSRSVSLFLANAYAKMQTFDKASEYYARALAAGSQEPSIHYDFGKA